MNVDSSYNNISNLFETTSSNISNYDVSDNTTTGDLLSRLFNLPTINELPINTFDISYTSPYNNWINNPLISPRRRRNRRTTLNFEFPNNIVSNYNRRRRATNIVNAIGDLLSLPPQPNDIGGINNLTNRVLQQSLYQEADSFKNVLSEKGKNSIKIKKYNDSFNDKKCPITCLDFENGQEIAELPCKHIFTPDSIFDWLENEKAECPICRFNLDSNEIKKDDLLDLNITNNTLTTTPIISNFLPTLSSRNNISSSINTDIELQRAILRSIQNPNNTENHEEEEIEPLIQPVNTQNTFYFTLPISEQSNVFNTGWSDDDFDITSESENEIDVEIENNVEESNDTNEEEDDAIEIIEEQLEEMINEIYNNIVEEELV